MPSRKQLEVTEATLLGVILGTCLGNYNEERFNNEVTWYGYIPNEKAKEIFPEKVLTSLSTYQERVLSRQNWSININLLTGGVILIADDSDFNEIVRFPQEDISWKNLYK